MAFRQALRQGNALPVVFGALAGSVVFYPTTAFAEEPLSKTYHRKPIYDDATLPAPSAPSEEAVTKALNAPPRTAATTPSVTDRLTVQVRRARLSLYDLSQNAEDGVNDLATRAFKLENNLTSTIQSLAPSRESGEHIMPGAIYVLVAAMGGSILTRNRGIVLRTIVPLGFGVTAANYTIPVTTRNVGNLIWSWEEQYPVVRDTHIDVQERVTRLIQTGKAHSQMGLDMAAERLADARKRAEDWVKQGK